MKLMFRLVLLAACLEEKLSTARERLLGALQLSVQIRAVVRSTCRHTDTAC